MGNTVDTSKGLSQTRQMNGRRVIKTSVREITKDNVVDVLQKALGTHELNRSEIDYLWNYYRGKQPILHRTKEVRPEICNKIVENRANEIVSFKVGYLCGEPIQYVGRNGEEATAKAITALNELMFAEDKATKDQEIVEWQMICGTAYRLVLPDEKNEEDEAPFELHTLDPRDTFVVYSSEIGNKPLMGVKYYKDDEEVLRFSVYTENRYYLIEGDILKEEKAHALDMIPIFEYPANNARLGSFEIVLPLLDTINNIESNRMDGMEQTIQASQMDRSLLTGEKFMAKHLNIGDQVAQVAGIAYPIPIDNYIKIVRGVKFYGRYMDDSYVIHENKEYLEELLQDIIRIAASIGITVNTRKTRICKLSEYWRFLQTQYSLTDTGRVIQKINPKRITCMRRKMKKLAYILPPKEFEDWYQSWFQNHYKIMSKQQRLNMNTLFNELKEVNANVHNHTG